MSDMHEREAQIRAWLRPGPEEAPGDLVESILAEIPSVRQRHGWELTPGLALTGRARLLIAATLTLAVAAGLLLLGALLAGSQPRVETWYPLADLSAFGNGTVADVVGWRGGLLAVGESSAGGHTIGTGWTSTDGHVWRILPANGAAIDLSLGRVATDGQTLVAIGYACAPGPGYCGAPSVLTSQDGFTWRPAPIPGADNVALLAIAASRFGFVIVGSHVNDSAPDAAAVLTSATGSAWNLETSTAAPFGGGSMSGIAAGVNGLVAVGTSPTGLTAWQSTDGARWIQQAIASPIDAAVADVAGGTDRYVAVGHSGGLAVAWTSPDGLTWTIQPGSPALDGARMTRVVWTGREFLALGTSSSGNGLAWTSQDGASWTRLDTGEIFSRASVNAGARIGAQLELFGVSAGGLPIVVLNRP